MIMRKCGLSSKGEDLSSYIFDESNLQPSKLCKPCQLGCSSYGLQTFNFRP